MQTTLFPINGWQQICDDYYVAAPVKRTFSFFTAPLTNSVPSLELSMQEFFYIISGRAFFMNNHESKSLAQRTFSHWKHYLTLHEHYAQGKCSLDDLCRFKKYGFDYVTIAGVFKLRRAYDCLTTRSAYIMLNFNELTDVENIFGRLQNDTFLNPVLLYRSMNNGIVAIVNITVFNQSYYSLVRELNSYIATEYHQTIFNPRIAQYTCPTFVTYDPQAWLSPNALAESEANLTGPRRETSMLLAA